MVSLGLTFVSFRVRPADSLSSTCTVTLPQEKTHNHVSCIVTLQTVTQHAPSPCHHTKTHTQLNAVTTETHNEHHHISSTVHAHIHHNHVRACVCVHVCVFTFSWSTKRHFDGTFWPLTASVTAMDTIKACETSVYVFGDTYTKHTFSDPADKRRQHTTEPKFWIGQRSIYLSTTCIKNVYLAWFICQLHVLKTYT